MNLLLTFLFFIIPTFSFSQINETRQVSKVNYVSFIMYHRFGDSKYPSTNIKKEQFIKHINELLEAKKRGFDIYLAFIIQREDCKKFKIADDIDPKYKKLLTFALKNKLKVICYDCKFLSKGIIINNQINFIK